MHEKPPNGPRPRLPMRRPFPETGDLGNEPSDEARGRVTLFTAMHGPRDVRDARYSD